MFKAHDYAKTIRITSGADLLDVCQNHDIIRQLIQEGFELQLPRVRTETEVVMPGNKPTERRLWFAECWWRCGETQTLGYYAKINLETGMLKEFRELSGEMFVPAGCNTRDQLCYLERCAEVIQDIPSGKERSDELDFLWQEAAGESLRKAVFQKDAEQNNGEYLLPLDSLTNWNWEKMKDLLLKRYDTSVEEIRDYREYLDSESEEQYIPPKYRAEAKEKGMRFWRDGNDV